MPFTPLSDARHSPLGATVKPRTQADDEVAELPEGVFFSATRSDDRSGNSAALYYKDGTGNVHRVAFSAEDRFSFATVSAVASFQALGDVLFVPEVDPRAWTAARERAATPLAELQALPRGTFFTALGTSESPASQRFGVYRLGRDGMFRRLLKNQTNGMHWSSAIPADRFGYFGQPLDVATPGP